MMNQFGNPERYPGDGRAVAYSDQKWSGWSSLSPAIQKNADGSVDVYFGPVAPAGKESNWVPTSANGKFEILFRLYGPQKPLFDKTWRLPDIEQVSSP